jgi:hypothetical protein
MTGGGDKMPCEICKVERETAPWVSSEEARTEPVCQLSAAVDRSRERRRSQETLRAP